MRSHRLAAAVITVMVAVAPAAGAAVRKPLCKQLTDPDNDSKVLYAVGDSAALEILSADIATGRKNLVAVLRMKSVDRDTATSIGVTYDWRFTVGGVEQELLYYVYNSGETQALYDTDAKNGVTRDAIPVGVVADPRTSTITWTVPRKLVVPLKKPGARFSTLHAIVKPGNNIWTSSGSLMHGTYGTGDTVETTRTYTDLTPTCVKGV